MKLPGLHGLCWTTCIVCILAGIALSVTMIWATLGNEFLLQAWTSIAVLFFASAVTLIVSKVVNRGKAGPAG